jgi:hypothetical protein
MSNEANKTTSKPANHRIRREWVRIGGKGQRVMKMRDCSAKLLHLLFTRNARLADWKAKLTDPDPLQQWGDAELPASPAPTDQEPPHNDR